VGIADDANAEAQLRADLPDVHETAGPDGATAHVIDCFLRPCYDLCQVIALV
jgi:hypothetical protein